MNKTPIAEREVERAREKLTATLGELQRRLNPKTIAAEVSESVRERAADVTGRSVAAAKARPVATAAIALPLIGFLFRHPLARGVNAVIGRKSDPSPPSAAHQEIQDGR